MNKNIIDSLSGHQYERLAHIELVARFWGAVSRADLMDRFNTSEAVATRDFSKYKDLAPNNLVYDPSVKKYLWDERQSSPFFSLSPYKVMSTLSDGFGDALEGSAQGQRFATTLHLKEPNLEIMSVITRSIHRQLVVKVKYHSKSRPEGSEREIVPHAIVDTGLRWHIRAWDRNNSEFRDFVVNRISEAFILSSKPLENELQTFDSAWMENVTLRLVPHPKREDIRALLVQEYSMKNEALLVECKNAVAAYLLDSWNVDASRNATLKGPHVFLYLSNLNEIETQVHNMFLAPGYNKEKL